MSETIPFSEIEIIEFCFFVSCAKKPVVIIHCDAFRKINTDILGYGNTPFMFLCHEHRATLNIAEMK